MFVLSHPCRDETASWMGTWVSGDSRAESNCRFLHSRWPIEMTSLIGLLEGFRVNSFV